MGYPYHRFICSYVHNGRVGVLVEFAVESDFTTRTAEFLKFSHDVAVHIAGMSPVDVEALLAQPFAREHSRTVAAVLDDARQCLQENIVVHRFMRWEAGETGGGSR